MSLENITMQCDIKLIKQQIKELQKKLEKLEALEPKRTLAELCENEPYTVIRYDHEAGVPYFSKNRSEVWNAMREMSKELFLIDNNLPRREYACIYKKPKKIREMTPEQQEIAAEFLDEYIALFNKYFIEINKIVLLDGEPYIVEHIE